MGAFLVHINWKWYHYCSLLSTASVQAGAYSSTLFIGCQVTIFGRLLCPILQIYNIQSYHIVGSQRMSRSQFKLMTPAATWFSWESESVLLSNSWANESKIGGGGENTNCQNELQSLQSSAALPPPYSFVHITFAISCFVMTQEATEKLLSWGSWKPTQWALAGLIPIQCPNTMFPPESIFQAVASDWVTFLMDGRSNKTRGPIIISWVITEGWNLWKMSPPWRGSWPSLCIKDLAHASSHHFLCVKYPTEEARIQRKLG